MSDKWDRYDTWNDAIAQVVFPETDLPRPVYLDLEGATLDQIGKLVGVASADVESEFAATVAATLSRERAAVFAEHLKRMRAWVRGGRVTNPPFLALLGIFSIAADRMATGEGMSSNNYYGRLRSVLNWGDQDSSLESAFRRVSERLWGELNRWLLELDGLRGLPTAFALSHRFVGLPVSQALIRSADHEKLKDFFRQFGFAPGADVAPTELKIPLGDWMSGSPSPVSTSLQRLWKKAAARERISEAASVSLAHWDGSVRERTSGDTTAGSGTLSLTLEIGGFPRKRFTLSALFYVNGATTPRTARVLTANPPTSIDLVPDLPGALGLGPGSSLHAGDVLEGVIRVEDKLSQQTLERRPRRLVLFREDDLSRRWIESPQVMLGDSVRLLAHEDLVPRLREVLEHIARPGWTVTQPYPGQPDGWSLITQVEIFSHPGPLVDSLKMDDLLPLVPLTTSQLKVTGGFALPGRVRGKWHSWSPPEIRAISDTPGGFIVRLIDTHRFDAVSDDVVEHVVAEWADDNAGVVVQTLADLELSDGDYRTELIAVGAKDPLATTMILLRSSDSPDLQQWANVDTVGYSPGLGVLGIRQSASDAVVEGHSVPSRRRHPAVPSVDVPSSPGWLTGRHTHKVRSPLRISVPDADSCIRTGRHIENIETVPTDSQGKPLQAWSQGRCEGCGLVRRYPTRLKRSSFKGNQSSTLNAATPVVTHDVSSLVPTVDTKGRDYETAFDALLHTGGGPWSQLERIALQVDSSPLFVDQLARNLEVLGHLDIRRDAATLQPTHWEICPTALVGTGVDYLFAGYWPSTLYREVTGHISELGLTFSTANVAEAPTQYFVNHDSVPRNLSRYLSGKNITAVDAAWKDIVAFLPPLTEILTALPRQSASVDGTVRWFDTTNASWADATSIEAPGAYRVRRFSTIDFVRTQEDIENNTLARSTVHLSKHLAALMVGKPLLSYDPTEEALFAPLGADLPALYGRAVVAASGLPPVALRKTGLLKYPLVPEELAYRIYDLLSR